MQAATTWGLVFYQDPAAFFAGSEFDMAVRLAAIPLAEEIVMSARKDAGRG